MAGVPQSPLGQLIQRVVDDNYDGVQDRLATAMGVSPQSISRYKLEYPLKTIVPSFLRDLAKAARIDLTDVVRAALSSARLPDAYDPPTALDDAVRRDATLSDDHKRLILALLTEAGRAPRRLRSVPAPAEIDEAAYSPAQPPGPVDE